MTANNVNRARFLVTAGLLLAAQLLRADDWPNFRGPNHNGISAESGWLAKWPADGPPRLWKNSVGLGFSSVSVSKGRVYTMGNRSDTDTVFCFDADTGKVVWKYSYACPTSPLFYEGGTSATPTVDGDSVYTLSRKGNLFCLGAADGKVIWSRNLAQELGLKMPTWGFASSALIDGSSVFLNVGTYGAAFDKAAGKLLWKTGEFTSGYSTPVPCAFGGKKAFAVSTAGGAAGVEMATGNKLWDFPWKTDYDVNAADPVIVGDQVFVTSSYGKTCALLRVTGNSAMPVWQNNNLLVQLNAPVLVDGYLYGVSGISGPTPNASLKCIDWQTGSVKWIFPDLGGGALMVADAKIIAMSDKGELMIAPASPQGFTPISRTQVLGGRCWTVPVLANGRIYCRNARGDLVCLDVKGH
jgi:outer membrane protein assembly factor BamB